MRMRCLECDSYQLQEDEATGEMICSECGTGTGRFEGITQSQGYMETRGLRVVGGISQKPVTPDPFFFDSTSKQLQEPGVGHTSSSPPHSVGAHSPPIGTTVNATGTSSVPIAQHPIVTRGQLSSSSESEGVGADSTTRLAPKPKPTLRPWRLSEPFTCLMRQQSIEFSRLTALTALHEERFLATVWRLWLNYLAITGELGERAWRIASSGPGRAMSILLKLEELNRLHRRGVSPSSVTRRSATPRDSDIKRPSDVVQQDWQVVQRRLDHFLWVGWGSLYEPNEGREALDPFLRSLQRAHAASVHKLQKRRAVSKPKTPIGASTSSPGASEDLVETDDDWLSAVELEPIDTLKDEAVVRLMSSDPDTRSTSRTDSQQTAWRNYVVMRLSQSQPWKRTFWRGQVPDVISRALVEYNLAILFFAHLTEMPVRPAVNPIAWPHTDVAFLSSGLVTFSQMVTLHDIVELGNSGKLTLSIYGSWLPRGLFTAHDQALHSLLKGRHSVSMEHLTSAAVRLTHFFGLYQLPKFPFSWLVRRFVVTLGLPDSLYNVCRLLLRHFSLKLRHSTTLTTGPTLIPFIPWARVLRVEVIAMAVVVISLRLLFKFNDVYEHQLNKVFRKLYNPCVYTVDDGAKGSPSLFDWVAWARYITGRFRASSLPTIQPGSFVPECNTTGTSQRSDIPAVYRASSDDLDHLEDVRDFLGSTEFEPGKSVGWGEDSMRQRKHAQAGDKLAMSKPIRELLNHSLNSPIHRKEPVDPEHSSSLPKPFFLTPSVIEGSSSAFRHTSLDFLINPDFDWSRYSIVGSSNSADRSVALEHWKDLITRRSDYHVICTGQWSVNSSSWWARKHRDRLEKELVLPESVRQLIDMHDAAMARAFESSSTDNEQPPNGSVNTASPNIPEAFPKESEISAQPSASIRWLVNVCSTVCDATSPRHLLREINSVEKLLFANNRGRDKVFLSDLALFSCLDLQEQPG